MPRGASSFRLYLVFLGKITALGRTGSYTTTWVNLFIWKVSYGTRRGGVREAADRPGILMKGFCIIFN